MGRGAAVSSDGARVAAAERARVAPSGERDTRPCSPEGSGAGLPSPLVPRSPHRWHRRAARRAAVITPCAYSPVKRSARSGVLAAKCLCGRSAARGGPGNGRPLFRRAHRGVRVRRRRFAGDAWRAQDRPQETDGAPTKARARLRGHEAGPEAAGGATLASDAPPASETRQHRMRRIRFPSASRLDGDRRRSHELLPGAGRRVPCLAGGRCLWP